MRVLRNKKGMAYLLTCVIVLTAMMMVSVLFQYRYVYSAIREQRDEAQMQLDSVILKSAMENYDALKRGSTYREYIDYAKLEQDAYAALGFADTDAEWLEAYGGLHKMLSVFYRFLKKYYETFMAEKKRRAICEFSDVDFCILHLDN